MLFDKNKLMKNTQIDNWSWTLQPLKIIKGKSIFIINVIIT